MLVAPFIGSFAGVLVRRLPDGRPVMLARSACEHCGAGLGPRDLVPLISYLILRGRCRRCGGRIGRFHPLMELAAIAIALWAATVFGGDLLWASCALGWSLLALLVSDWRRMVLPDVVTLPLLVLGLVVTLWTAAPDLEDHAIAACLGYLSFRAIAVIYRLVRQREGLGAGDAKLLATAGAWLGTDALASVVLIAALAGLALTAGMALRGRSLTARTMVPFGSYLAAAIWLVWLYG